MQRYIQKKHHYLLIRRPLEPCGRIWAYNYSESLPKKTILSMSQKWLNFSTFRKQFTTSSNMLQMKLGNTVALFLNRNYWLWACTTHLINHYIENRKHLSLIWFCWTSIWLRSISFLYLLALFNMDVLPEFLPREPALVVPLEKTYFCSMYGL
jgi:hypothetical protein